MAYILQNPNFAVFGLYEACFLQHALSAVLSLHVVGTSRNAAFAPFTFHMSHTFSVTLQYNCFAVYNCMRLSPCRILALLFSKLHVACALQNRYFVDTLYVAGTFKNPAFAHFTLHVTHTLSSSYVAFTLHLT